MNITKNILLCAYACEPHKGSEPGVGWETSIHLAQQDMETNYYVVTRKNNRLLIEEEGYPKNLSFIYYDLPSLFLFIKRKTSFVRIYYYLWMLGAVIKLWRKRNEFQIIHHITFVNDWFPSLFILLKNSNNFFIWGPIGSNKPINNKFLNSKKDKNSEKIKTLVLKTIRKLDIFFWICKTKADIIIGINENVKNVIRIKNKDLHKFISMPAISIRKATLNELGDRNLKIEEFRVISAGQLRYIKNFRLTIKSFSNFLNLVSDKERESIKLQIVGSGNQKTELINYVKELKISKNVDFNEQIEQRELMNCFKKSDLFLFPTLESAGFVILEAMSNYLPVLALDYGGPKEFIHEFKEMQLVSEKDDLSIIENNLAQKMLCFYNNPDMVSKVGKSNFKTVIDNFTWEEKTREILRIYKNIFKANV